MTGALCLAGASVLWQAQTHAADAARGAKAAQPHAGDLANDTCLGCHGNPGFAAPGVDGKARPLHVIKDKFGRSVHGKRQCVECHADITEIPHKKGMAHTVNCVNCHDALWKAAKAGNKTGENPRLGVVVEQIDHYMKSIHARANRNNQSRANATCYDCHAPHSIYPKGSAERAEWRLSVPDVCGKCHAREREEYATSVHGKAVLNGRNPVAAICSDCHTTHDVADPAKDSARLAITKNCGNCHAQNLKSYTGTYHGQVNTLGYAYTAKCFDCHDSHGVQAVNDPKILNASGQPASDLPEMPCGSDRGFDQLRTPRHVPQFRPLSHHLDRVEIPVADDRRHFRVLLVPYRLVVLPRIQGAQGTHGPAARQDG